MAEMNANRRVPTAADVERWGFRWWYENHKGDRYEAILCVPDWDEGEVRAHSENWYDCEYQSPVEPEFHRWLGPVNPEPLPWPEGDPCGP